MTVAASQIKLTGTDRSIYLLRWGEYAEFRNKLRKVVRHLVNYRILSSRMQGTAKEYCDEPAKQMNYTLKPGKAELIRKGKTDHTMAPEDESAFLLRHAYPTD